MALQNPPRPFVWGPDGQPLSYEDLERLQEIEARRQAGGVDTSPVGHWTQGLARVANAAVGAYNRGQLRDQQAAINAENEGLVRDFYNPSAGTGASSSAVSHSPLPAPAAELPKDRGDFVRQIAPAAIAESQRTGVDPRIIIGQAAVESGWGRSAPGNNLFGIKSHGMPGGQQLATTEVVNGQPMRTVASFRSYASPQDSVKGYGDFILQNPRYEPFRTAQGMDAQIAALGQSGYATDPAYAQKVGLIARRLNLPMGVPEGDPQGAPSALSFAGPAEAGMQTDPASGGLPPGAASQDLVNNPVGAPLPPDPRSFVRVASVDPNAPIGAAATPSSAALADAVRTAGVQGKGTATPAPESVQRVVQASTSPDVPAPISPYDAASALQSGGPAVNTEALIRAMTSPRASPQVRAVAGALLQNELAARRQAADPLRAAQIEQIQLENARLRNSRQPLVNGGEGRLYDPNSGRWITAPDAGNKAPTVQEFYDPESGQPYQAQWNRQTGGWDRVGGVKKPAQRPIPAAVQAAETADLEDIQTLGQINDTLGKFDQQIAAGKLVLGPVQNMISGARNWMGNSDEGSRNYASFTAGLEKLRNDSLRLNKGVQTEGDAQRAWNELVANINDPAVVRQRLGEIQALNRQAVQFKYGLIDNRRTMNGLDPLDARGIVNSGRGGAEQRQPSARQQDAAPSAVVPQGARQAPDGNWYTPDPYRPGKYLRVEP